VAVQTMSRPAGARDKLHRLCDELIAAEMTRLSRRSPALRSAELDEVRAALARLTQSLVLSGARSVTEDKLAVLFNLTEAER